ncbi:MAG: hypothetical protein QM478_12065 [Flavobacteriaceae bacterium]
MQRIIIFMLLISSLNVFSQEKSMKEVDAITLDYYDNQQWEELIDYGENKEVDYYYFNVRMGIAYFNTRQYHSAEKYFLRATTKNDGDFAKEYLFWTYFNLGENILAEKVYDELSEPVKKQIDYKKTAVEYVYVEGGIKTSNVTNIENTFYGNVMLKHRLGDNIRVLHSINLLSQNQSFQDYNSFQYHIFVLYYFKTSSIGVGGIFSKSDFNQVSTSDFDQPGEFLSLNTNSFYAFYSKRINRLKLNTSINYVSQKGTNKIGSLNSPMTSNSDVSESVIIPSIGLNYTPSFLRDRISLGAEVFIPITDIETYVVVKPYINLFILDSFWVNMSYLQVHDHLFVDYSSEILFNTPDQSVNRFVTTANYTITKKIVAKLTYTNENYDYESLNFNYYINSLFLGIQFKF